MRRPADYSQVQPDRHHLRGMRPFAMQPVEGVDRISGEIGGAAEPVGMEELHVVGVEGIWQHQVPLVSDLHEIWQVVVVGVARIEEAAVLDHGLECVHAEQAGVPAERRLARGLGDHLHRLPDVIELLLEREVAILDPAPAVARHLVAGRSHRLAGGGIELESPPDRP
jgi:hypothetical protein